ncbi:MAG: tetratricopeptide repeat protein [Candidatus Eisenbacteria bacterium]
MKPVLQAATGATPPADTIRPSKYSRWRAATLASVYVLMAIHIAHWRIAGRTLAPLEVHEVMYTLELGVITAGFLLMAAAFVSAALVGRFFCSWGCHLLAVEDLSAWALKKVGIRPRPIRSRLLLFVPIAAMFYMIVWPQIARWVVHTWPRTATWLGARPDFELRVITDSEGWASFVTTDFWRNLPGPVIGVATLLVCGFLVVYMLGSRSFCTYACPYGVIFGFLDRFAPGRLVLKGDCTGCGHCTAVCSTGLRVHEEVERFGKVVSPGCLKDLDCVSACPTGGLRFSWTKPALFASLSRRGRPRVRYGFSLGEEILMGVVFLAALFIFRGLYSVVPFLMTLGIGVVLAGFAVLTWRLYRRRDLYLHRLQLKRQGHVTNPGKVFAVLAVLVTVFLVDSGFVRYHEVGTTRTFDRLHEEQAGASSAVLVDEAQAHLRARERWGLFRAPDLDWRQASLSMYTGDFGSAETRLRQMLARHPRDLEARVQLARTLIAMQRPNQAEAELERVTSAPARSESDGPRMSHLRAEASALLGSVRATSQDPAGAIAAFEASLDEDPAQPQVHLALSELLAQQQRIDESARHLEQAIVLAPNLAAAHYNLGVVRVMQGRDAEAMASLERAIEIDPKDPVTCNTLGRLKAIQGDFVAAEALFRQALRLDPSYEDAQANLTRVLASRSQMTPREQAGSGVTEGSPDADSQTSVPRGSAP